MFQFKRNQQINKLQKINDILKIAFDLRRSSQNLRILISHTDDVDSFEDELDVIDKFTENASNVLNNPKTSTSELYGVEQKLLNTTLGFDLLSKQINEQIRFNKECADFEVKLKVS